MIIFDRDTKTLEIPAGLGNLEIVITSGASRYGVSSLNGQKGDLTLKTVNGNAILGSGDIVIEGGMRIVNFDEMTKAERAQLFAELSEKWDSGETINDKYIFLKRYNDFGGIWERGEQAFENRFRKQFSFMDFFRDDFKKRVPFPKENWNNTIYVSVDAAEKIKKLGLDYEESNGCLKWLIAIIVLIIAIVIGVVYMQRSESKALEMTPEERHRSDSIRDAYRREQDSIKEVRKKEHEEYVLSFHDAKIIDEEGCLIAESKMERYYTNEMCRDWSAYDLMCGFTPPTPATVYRMSCYNKAIKVLMVWRQKGIRKSGRIRW